MFPQIHYQASNHPQHAEQNHGRGNPPGRICDTIINAINKGRFHTSIKSRLYYKANCHTMPAMRIPITLTFTEELLGTAAADPRLHTEFIASKAPTKKSLEEEIAQRGAEEVEVRSMSVFPREKGAPFLYDYQIKGFFKDACGCLARVPDTKSSKLKAYRKVIDGTIFVFPRKIFIQAKGEVGDCQRPLRASGPSGERVALAHSETAPAGSQIEFEVELLDGKQWPVVKEWLDYGRLRGIGQWRNSGKGRFTYKAAKA